MHRNQFMCNGLQKNELEDSKLCVISQMRVRRQGVTFPVTLILIGSVRLYMHLFKRTQA